MQAALAPLVGDRAAITYSTNNGLIEISAPEITKAAGLAKVAERLGVPHSGIVAFGDMPNDVPVSANGRSRRRDAKRACGRSRRRRRRSPPPISTTVSRRCSALVVLTRSQFGGLL